MLAGALVLVGVVGTWSLSEGAPQSAQAQQARPDLVAKLTGKKIKKNPATGELQAINVDEAQEIVEQLVAMTNRSTEGLTPVTGASGVSLALEGRFMHVMIGRPNPDGTTSMRCVTSADEGVAFLSEEPADIR
jgi:hypothetical protein